MKRMVGVSMPRASARRRAEPWMASCSVGRPARVSYSMDVPPSLPLLMSRSIIASAPSGSRSAPSARAICQHSRTRLDGDRTDRWVTYNRQCATGECGESVQQHVKAQLPPLLGSKCACGPDLGLRLGEQLQQSVAVGLIWDEEVTSRAVFDMARFKKFGAAVDNGRDRGGSVRIRIGQVMFDAVLHHQHLGIGSTQPAEPRSGTRSLVGLHAQQNPFDRRCDRSGIGHDGGFDVQRELWRLDHVSVERPAGTRDYVMSGSCEMTCKEHTN